MLIKRITSLGALLAIMVGVSSCAVGPDFVVPAPPDVGRYTKERLAPRTSSADTHNGRAEHFVNGRDVSAEWWQLFRSRALNSLISKSLAANPNLQSTMAALRAAEDRCTLKGHASTTRTSKPRESPPAAPVAGSTGGKYRTCAGRRAGVRTACSGCACGWRTWAFSRPKLVLL